MAADLAGATERRRVSLPTVLIVAVAAGFFGQFALEVFKPYARPPSAIQELSGKWEYCVPDGAGFGNCRWMAGAVPGPLPRSALEHFRGWIQYRHRFTTVARCLGPDSRCAVYIQEIGDAAEVRLNGRVIGSSGKLPPNPLYSKHHPNLFPIAPEELKPIGAENLLSFRVFSMKEVQAGIRPGVIGIFDERDGHELARIHAGVNVVIPIAAAMGLLLVALLATFPFILGGDRGPDGVDAALRRYGFASACFLLSFSEVPREYLPIGVAGYAHFLLRILHDWTFFELVVVFIPVRSRAVRWVRAAYGATVAAFLYQFLSFSFSNGGDGLHFGRGFDVGFLTLRIAVPLLVLPHAMAIWFSRTLVDTIEKRIFRGVFAITLLFQIHDSLIFHGVIAGLYFVKWYPLGVGIVFGALLIRRRHHEAMRIQRQSVVDSTVSRIAAQVAHDIRSPLFALEVVQRDLDRVDPETRELICGSIGRIREIAENLLPRELSPATTERVAAMGKGVREPEACSELIAPLIESILAEKRCEHRDRKGLEFRALLPSGGGEVMGKFEAVELKRILSNLVNNSVESIEAGGSVTVSLESRGDAAIVTVSDDGRGIPSDLLPHLGIRGLSSGKANGNGLGLSHARSCLEAWGGSISIVSQEGRGTAVSLEIPGR